jgi:hypothetical protein
VAARLAGSNTAGGCAGECLVGAAVAGRPEREAGCPGQAARPGGRPGGGLWHGGGRASRKKKTGVQEKIKKEYS